MSLSGDFEEDKIVTRDLFPRGLLDPMILRSLIRVPAYSIPLDQAAKHYVK